MLSRQKRVGSGASLTRFSAAFCGALLAILIFAPAVSAQTLMFVAGPDYQPYVDQDTSEGGIATQVLREVLATQGYKLQVDFLPWRRGWQLMMEGTYTGTFPYAMTSERASDVLFSESLVMVRTYVYYPPDTPSWWFGPHSAAGKTYCRPEGWSDPPALTLEEANKRITRISTADLAGCLRMLAAKRVDFFIADSAIVQRNLPQSGELPTVQRGPLITEVPLAVAVSKTLRDGDKIVNMINRGLATLSANGRLEQLRGYP
jgi:polar amino acid transport system substrate-binding protein